MSNLKKDAKNASKTILKNLGKMSKSNKIMLAVVLLMVATPIFAQSTGGAGAIGDAVTEINSYWTNLKKLVYAIGAIVGLIGGLRIYNKWTNGDQDVNKEIMGWGGACIFLLLVPTFVDAFFN